MQERRFSTEIILPKDEATVKLIRHMAEENYNLRTQLCLPGDELSDWLAAEKRYVRTFMRRRYEDK